MKKPIFDPEYWRKRLEIAVEPHHAIFVCVTEKWRRIEEKHREILGRIIQPTDSILDAGCGWGRLLELMPDDWCGDYTGVDISPDFLGMAAYNYPQRHFILGDIRCVVNLDKTYDYAVMISIRPMMIREAGVRIWNVMEKALRTVSRKLLYLEYDEKDEGSIE